MIVIKNHQPCEDPINYLGFEELSHLGKECIFFYGGHANQLVLQPSHLPKYFFSTEEQTWDLDTTNHYIDQVEKIFTICPPSITNRLKREYCFFPFNENFVPKNFDKIYDIIYCGNATGGHVSEIIEVISKFNYRLVSQGQTYKVTNPSVLYSEKIKLITQSKITAVHSLTGVGTPQIKTRPFDAAFCKSLILCKRDNWNIIEEWFEPNKEFLYYDDASDMERIINEVINNYEDYLPIIEAAHTRALNSYTTRHFIEKYLK